MANEILIAQLQGDIEYFLAKSAKAHERGDLDMADHYHELAQRTADKITALANEK